MDDEFLKQYRKQPRPAFTESLYRKISTKERIGSGMRKFSFAFTAFLAVIALTLGFSPQARGAALELIREVGGLRFHETSDYPGGGEPVEIVPSKYISLEEARQTFPGFISLPISVPDGYTLDPEVELIDFNGGQVPVAVLNWKKETAEGSWSALILRITYTTGEVKNYAEVVGNGAIEEITIHGKPAAIIKGGWNYDTQSYDHEIAHHGIRWMYGEQTFYSLESSSGALSKEELIKIAESIP